jgi:cytochrome P450
VLNDPKLSLGLLDQLDRDLSSPAWQTLRRSLSRIDDLLLQEIDFRRMTGRSEQGDLLDTLLAATYENGAKLEDRAVRDELMTLIVTGYETTGTALAWAFYWLAREPLVLDRLRSELAPLGRMPAPSHLAQVKYLHAVCQETLRIQPIIPIVAREVQQPMPVQGYRIPAGVTVAACIYLAHHRSAAFPSAESFQPERFLEGSPTPWEYLPFGGGVRRCIGMSLALLEMKIVLGSILVNYEFEPVVQELRPVRRMVTLAPEGGMALRIRRIPADE